MGKAKIIKLTDEERKTLFSWLRSGTTEYRLVERAKIILAAADGQSTQGIAEILKTRPARVSKWRTRFQREGIKGLQDAPRRGAPRRYDQRTERRILEVLDKPPPEGFATWTGFGGSASGRCEFPPCLAGIEASWDSSPATPELVYQYGS